MSKHFIDKLLLPTINAQTASDAHDLRFTLQSILADKTSIAYHPLAEAVSRGITRYGIECYRTHPKGTGVICTAKDGIPPHVFITEYLGEAYPAYRWCEKLAVISDAQDKYQLKPTLPDFYNILLECPRRDAKGYGLLYVDASEKANLGSSCSHSCDPNCVSNVVARNGRLTIALTSTRHIGYGEEICMDYNSVTSSEVEWQAAVCLCGTSKCRGRFLQYATQEELQQILMQNCGPLWRYASMLRACSMLPLSKADEALLDKHGFRSLVLGSSPSVWLRKYVADALRYIEFERQALPCALLRAKAVEEIEYYSADFDARGTLEQRVQSLACCVSLVSRVQMCVEEVGDDWTAYQPLSHLSCVQAVDRVWDRLVKLPALISTHLLGEGNKLTEVDAAVVVRTVASIVELLQTKPSGPASLRVSVLQLRMLVVGMESLSTSTARLRLLGDVLLLWANTTNFSVAQRHVAFQSAPVTVVARELASVVSRSVLTGAGEGVQGGKRRSANGLDRVVNKKKTSRTCEKFESENRRNATTAVDGECYAMGNVGNGNGDHGNGDNGHVSKSSVDSELKSTDAVYTGSKQYGPYFVFWQLMSWFHAGSDKREAPPDLFGCVLLPEPEACFGRCDGEYKDDRRLALIELLSDERKQMLSWPQHLKDCFNSECLRKYSSHEEDHLFGSPMLDVALGLVHAVDRVRQELLGKAANILCKDEDVTQFDSNLPPELPTEWVQCDLCSKYDTYPHPLCHHKYMYEIYT